MVHETRLAPELSITFEAGDYDGGEGARGLAIQSLHVSSQRCVASVLHALLHALHKY